jgi:hypothetical protein
VVTNIPFEVYPDLDKTFINTGTYHGVTLYFELDPAADLPPGEYLPRVIPAIDARGREVYRIGDLHEVLYEAHRFEVGKIRHPPTNGARLYVLKKRRKPIEVLYQGQTFQVKVDAEWTPSIFFLREMGRDDKGPWRSERLRIGSSEIFHHSRQPDTWTVEGRPYTPRSSDVYVLTGALRFHGR